jgi:hypothetical protein
LCLLTDIPNACNVDVRAPVSIFALTGTGDSSGSKIHSRQPRSFGCCLRRFTTSASWARADGSRISVVMKRLRIVTDHVLAVSLLGCA